jgi:MFS family permease
MSAETSEAGRPTERLPMRQLLSISIYWFGINAVWGGYEIFGQKRVEEIVGQAERGTIMGNLELLVALVAVLVQPTVGTISDYTMTRWGRRKPFILIGTILDVVFIVLIATSHTLLGLAVFLLVLQFTSNFAQGPFQGYVPDLVPERQVGIASGLMGLMRMLGLVGGAALVSTGAMTGNYELPFIIIGVIELALALMTVVLVREGRAARDRGGRSWMAVAREAWGTDVLRERSFLFMSGTRLLFLMGTGIFVNLSLYYMRDSLGLQDAALTTWLIIGTATLAVSTAVGTLPAAWVSNKTGRKPVIRAAAAIAAVGILLIARAPTPIEAMVGIFLMGLGAGAYLAVDWALMTETIPKAASGRYMGLANIANSTAGPIGLVIGGRVLDAVTASSGLAQGPRAAIATGVVFLVIGSVLLTWVHPRVDPRMLVEPAPLPVPSVP